MKLLSLASLTILATTMVNTPAFAHNSHYGSCDTNINGEVSFAKNTLTVTTEQDEKISFDPRGNVTHNGSTVVLTSAQQNAAINYYEGVETAIPMVVDITVEALNITNIALTDVFTGFLGSDSELPAKISDKLKNVGTSIEEHVYKDPTSLTFNSTYLENELGLDDNLDAEIEALKEEAMGEFMGEIFMALGKAMMSGDSNLSDFESRMETLGSDIEQKVESLAVQLEDKADALCDTFERIDNAENTLNQVKALRHLDVMNVTNKQ
ncbi:MAG: DUF2884 family protein [Glaciecola sp.]